MKKVYLASAFFNEKEIAIMKDVLNILRDKGLEVFAPYEHQNKHLEFGSMEWRKQTFAGDIQGIMDCDVMVAILDGNYSDSGTCFETAFCHVFPNKKLIVVNPEGKSINLMIAETLHAVVDLKGLEEYDFNEMKPIPYTEYVW